MFWDKYFTDAKWGLRNRGMVWLARSWALAYFLLFVMLMFCLHLSYWSLLDFNPSAFFDSEIQDFYKRVVFSFGVHGFYEFFAWIKALIFNPLNTPLFPIIPFVVWKFVKAWMPGKNPYKLFPHLPAQGRKAMEEDIEKMGLFDGFITVLGRFKGKYLRFPETFSALVSAPPGTGKTIGVVIPTIFNCDGVSMVINDPKPELCDTTSGYRSTIGPCFTLNWGAEDEPEKGIYYPKWNCLSPKLVPPPGPERDMYIDRLVNVLVQDKDGSSADPHWSNTGRNALAGFCHFIVSKFEKAEKDQYFFEKLKKEEALTEQDKIELKKYYMAMQGDAHAKGALKMLEDDKLDMTNYVPIGTWDGIPDAWIGMEPSIPAFLDWMTNGQLEANEAIKKRQQSGDQSAMFADPMKDFFNRAVLEAEKYRYTHRAILEINQLANTPDKERGSILSNSLTGVSIFKNAAVRERTISTDFSFKDLRGMLDPADGKIKPITVYLSVDVSNARSLNKISGMFIELMSAFLISHPPDTEFKGEQVGPYPVLFALDEFPQMPRLDAIIDGPAVGRGQKVSYLLICQDLQQITADYGADAVETVMSTTAAKVVLCQNNMNTARRFAELSGKHTIELKNKAKTDKYKAIDVEEKGELFGGDIYNAHALTRLDPKKQVVFYQGWTNHPIEADMPRWYEDDEMKAKHAMPKAPYLPQWCYDARTEKEKKQVGIV